MTFSVRWFAVLVPLGVVAAACGTSGANGSGHSDGGPVVTGGGGSGGVNASGGGAAAGGSSSAGAAGSGGAVAGGSGGAGAGGTGGSAGAAGAGGTGGSEDGGGSSDAGTVCPLPTTFKWTSTAPLAQPKSGWVAIKDFSDVVFNSEHIVYMSTVNTAGTYGGGMMTFTDWTQAATATQNTMPVATVAPTLFYFTPKNIWVLAYEWGASPFGYLTSTDPTNPSGWSSPQALFTG